MVEILEDECKKIEQKYKTVNGNDQSELRQWSRWGTVLVKIDTPHCKISAIAFTVQIRSVSLHKSGHIQLISKYFKWPERIVVTDVK